MGDADVTQIMAPVAEELEDLLDDALDEVDEEVSRLFAFMRVLHQRTTYVMSEIASWQKFRRCFTALNIFVIPVITAIGLAYGTAEVGELSSELETGLHMFIMLMMYISGCIGFPLYIFSVWEAYFTDNKVGNSFARRARSDGSGVESDSGDDSEVRLAEIEDSFETVSEFRRLMRNRHNARRSLERGLELAEEVREEPRNPRVEDMPENGNNNELIPVNQPHIDMDSSPKPNCFEGLENKDQDEFYGVKVYILNASQDLSVEIEKKEETFDDLEEKSCEQLPAIRDIVVENVGEGDNSKEMKTLKDIVTTSVKKFSVEQGFGL